jgi:hypothetical protein
MATVTAFGGAQLPNVAILSTAQTGNAVSTNILDRGAFTERPAMLKLVTTVGATPTCTYALGASTDGVDWFAVPHAEVATPTTVAVATFVITTATTAWKILLADYPWRYFRLTYSVNTNVTNTAEVTVF